MYVDHANGDHGGAANWSTPPGLMPPTPNAPAASASHGLPFQDVLHTLEASQTLGKRQRAESGQGGLQDPEGVQEDKISSLTALMENMAEENNRLRSTMEDMLLLQGNLVSQLIGQQQLWQRHTNGMLAQATDFAAGTVESAPGSSTGCS